MGVPQDDMELALDFFSYFEATAAVLDADPSLYCVSSWNDHGQVGRLRAPCSDLLVVNILLQCFLTQM